MRQNAQHNNAENNQLLFLPGVFNETLGLLFDAHQYFHARGAEDQATIDPTKRLYYANEMSKITLRLTSAMAWLMVRRAVNAGRIGEEKANSDYRLNAKESCAPIYPEMMVHMPSYLAYLSERSQSIYARVERLDQMIADKNSLTS